MHESKRKDTIEKIKVSHELLRANSQLQGPYLYTRASRHVLRSFQNLYCD